MFDRERLKNGLLALEINGHYHILLNEEEKSIRDQIRVIDAIDLLDCYDVSIDAWTDEELLELGYALEDERYRNVGDMEYAILQELGFIE